MRCAFLLTARARHAKSHPQFVVHLVRRAAQEKAMSQLMDLVASQLDAGTLGKLSGSLGVDQGQVEQVVSGAMPLLVNALARNASDDRGAS